MANVSAPYNFVPLNKDVFFPPWANLVNHDVPFKEGLSGQIKLEITAETPIFIRGIENKKEDENSSEPNRFPKKGDRYYIPGSSIKGEITNVLEILSFSKLRFFNDELFSYRDWDNSKIYNLQDFSSNKVKGGWLTKTAKGYKIEYSTKEIGRISHIQLKGKFNVFENAFSTDFDENNEKNEEIQTSKYKYQETNMYNNDTNIINFNSLKFNTIKEDRKLKCSFSDNGEIGKIVFTGQSSKRKEESIKENNERINASGKGYEFVFWDSNLKMIELDTIDGKLNPYIENFFLTYNNHKPKEQTDDWKMWMHQLNNGFRVPVFLRTDRTNRLIDFGISMLYKLLYKKSIKTLIEENINHIKKEKDFIESLFGNINTSKLKGRVHFSHAFSTNTIKEFTEPFTTTLGSPKASFYPFYIKQFFRKEDDRLGNDYEIQGEHYLTFNDGKISGRKRYPAILKDKNNLLRESIEASTTTSTFYPLEKGAKFECTITYHNLLKEELGGLLSALTFHNTPNLFHKIGGGKPLGLGSTKLTITQLTINNDEKEINTELNKYLCFFEKIMNSQVPNWINTDQIKELVAIASPVTPNRKLEYLKIIPEERTNEFSDIKKNRPATKIPKALPSYSVFMEITPVLESKLGENCISTNLNFDEKLSTDFSQKKINDKKELITEKLYEIKQKIKTINNATIEQKKSNKLEKNREIRKVAALKEDLSAKIREVTKIRDFKKLDSVIRIWKKKSGKKSLSLENIKALTKKITEIYLKQSTNNKKKWKIEKDNFAYKKIAEWIGPEYDIEKTSQILQEVLK